MKEEIMMVEEGVMIGVEEEEEGGEVEVMVMVVDEEENHVVVVVVVEEEEDRITTTRVENVVGRGRKKMILFPCRLQWTVACNLVEQVVVVMSPCARGEGVVVVGEIIIMGICKTVETSVLDTNKSQMIIITMPPSKGMIIIGAPITTGKMAEVEEEGDFPEEEEEAEEDALEEEAEDASRILRFIPTNNNKTLSEKEEKVEIMARR